jgi:hypothetical protein
MLAAAAASSAFADSKLQAVPNCRGGGGGGGVKNQKNLFVPKPFDFMFYKSFLEVDSARRK